MSINSVILAALTPIVSVVKPDIYVPLEGEIPATEYITFNYSEIPDDFGDNEPHAIRYLVQVHYFCPLKVNSLTKKKQIKRALMDVDFTYPSVTNATDEDGQHFILECEGLDGDV